MPVVDRAMSPAVLSRGNGYIGKAIAVEIPRRKRQLSLPVRHPRRAEMIHLIISHKE